MKNRKRATSAIIFLVTLCVFFGGLGATGYFFLKNRSGSSGGPGGVTLSAPTNFSDFFVSLYLDFRRSDLVTPAGSDPETVVFTIEQGEAVGQIAARLQSEGLIRDAELFRLYLRYAKLDSGVEAGQFTLKKSMTIPQIAQALQSGKRGDELTLTIPEGRRLEEVAAIVAQQTPISATAFLSLALNAQAWVTQYPLLADLAAGRFAGRLPVSRHVPVAERRDRRGPGGADAGQPRPARYPGDAGQAGRPKAHSLSGDHAGFDCRARGGCRRRTAHHRERVHE